MTTITLKINEKSKAGKLLTSMIELLSKDENDVKVIDNKSNSGINQAIEDVKKGNINCYKDSTELFKKVLNV